MVARRLCHDDRRDIRARVARGARLLDRGDPGWACRVDRDRLDMTSTEADILGQLYGNYANGFKYAIRILSAARPWHATWFGFTAVSQTITEFDALRDEWLGAIRTRLGG